MQNIKKTQDSFPSRVIKNGLLLFPIGLCGAAYGQAAEDVSVVVVDGSNLFMALLIGFILAVGIQLVLTQFSIAFGFANLGDLSASPDPHEKSESHWSLDRVCSKLGAWGLVTASISLFFASFLTMTLISVPTLAAAGVLAFVIWAVFIVAMTMLEADAIHSIFGSLVATATSGLRGVYRASASVFSRSQEKQMAHTAAAIAASVRDEILGTDGIRKMRKDLRKYFSQFDARQWSPEKIKEDILSLLDETEIEAIVHDHSRIGGGNALVARLKTHNGHGSKNGIDKMRKLNEAIYQIQHEAHSRKDLPSKVIDGALQLAGKSSEEAQVAREKIESYLLETGKEELDPSRIKEDLELLLKEPGEGYRSLK
ncbi:MAG: hypothetical protein KC931_23305, partial [Candidatus Omnitrophica bacterium]|nr:hypothetical protein [Candidatus Omnitrophota bacterium]